MMRSSGGGSRRNLYSDSGDDFEDGQDQIDLQSSAESRRIHDFDPERFCGPASVRLKFSQLTLIRSCLQGRVRFPSLIQYSLQDRIRRPNLTQYSFQSRISLPGLTQYSLQERIGFSDLTQYVLQDRIGFLDLIQYSLQDHDRFSSVSQDCQRACL